MKVTLVFDSYCASPKSTQVHRGSNFTRAMPKKTAGDDQKGHSLCHQYRHPSEQSQTNGTADLPLAGPNDLFLG